MIDASSRVFCIIGNPVRHSFSPAMHNAAFSAGGINAVYTAFEVRDLKNAVNGIKALGIGGASVTIPFKVDIIPHLDGITEIAAMIGSVNTLVNKNGTITGDNTDAPGFFRAITGSTDTRGKNIALFGAGGAGRAILFSLFYYSEPSRVFLTDSIKERSDELKDNITGKFHGRAGIKEAVSIFRMKDWPVLKNSVDIIINATPGGMEPEINTSILEESSIPERIVLMDIVYHPHETLLIRSARNRGCRIVYGAEMLLYQGVLQFEIWTGREAPVEVMRKALLDKIYESEGLK